MGEENFQIIGADGTALFFCFRPPSLVLPPSSEGAKGLGYLLQDRLLRGSQGAGV